MRRLLLLLMLVCVLESAWASWASAECADINRMTSYYIEGAHDVIIYNRLTPLAYIHVRCNISPESVIQVTRGYLCDSDSILIDGEACNIFGIRTSRLPG